MPARHRHHHSSEPRKSFTITMESVFTIRWNRRSRCAGNHELHAPEYAVFPNAACVVTLVDRLVHRSEILSIDGDSYRFKEAQEAAAAKATQRATRRKARPRQ
jgi:hypothetical protein